MDKSAEQSLEHFKEILSKKWKELSEEDTRSKIIDPIFLECLNWNQEDISREEGINKGFVDYIFSIGGNARFLVEAKKEGISFELPEEFSRRTYIINGVISKGKELSNAIEQASRYCYEKGIRFAIITNGSQFVAFEGVRLGSEWRKGKCLIFKSFEDIEENYILFWNLFNRNSVEKGSFTKLLIENLEIINFNRPIEKFHNREEILIRNDLNLFLRPFIEFIFEEITQDSQKEVLKECYIHDKAYISLDERMLSYFVDKMPFFSNAQGIKWFREQENSAGLFQFSFRKCEEFVRGTPFQGSVIVLLGGIGSGKTTFIHRFFKIILGNRKQLLYFHVDFRDSSVKVEDIEEYIYRSIVDSLKDRYNDIKNKYLKDFSFSEPSDENLKSYTTCIFALLKSVGFSVSLVVDNVDQHEQEFQQKIFQVTKHICNDQKIVSILALREESFVEATQKGVHDAYYTYAFHIPSPRFEKLIESRLNYVIKLLDENVINIKEKIGTQINIEEKIDDIKDFFKIIRDSFSPRSSRYLSGLNLFLTSIASGNMRKALKMFNNFLTSGNTNINEMLTIYRGTGFYQIPYHAFVKSVILGDSKYYLSDKNPNTFNIFDINTNFSSSHLLHLRVLNYAFVNYPNISPIGKGFVEISKLKEEAEENYISKEAINDSLLKLAKYDLIQFENQSQKDLEKASYYCITATGIYYLTRLVKTFVYLDLIWIDTPISDNSVLGQLKKAIDGEHKFTENLKKLKFRFDRVDLFLKYLKEKEDQEFTLHPEYKESKLMFRTFIDNMITKYETEKAYITQKIINKNKASEDLNKSESPTFNIETETLKPQT